MYDLIIIGLGPAGLTAAIYAARYGLKTLVIGSSPGGLVAESGRVENYPGFARIEGPELAQRMIKQAKGFGVEVKNAHVREIKKENSVFAVLTEKEVFRSQGVILALGAEPRKLGIPGEAELLGRGVSYCALCDAPFFKDKTVAMVGGGDSALDGALELTEHTKKIYLIHRREEFRAKPDFVRRARENPKIEFVLKTNITEIIGKDKVEGVVLDEPHQGSNELSVEGVFIEIGSEPSRALSEQLGLELDDYGYIKVSEEMETNVAGVFAAGDITTGSAGMKQIVTAASEGAIAARSAYRYIRNRKEANKEESVMNPEKTPIVDKELCIGCGLCSAIAPGTFKLGDDGKSQVKDPQGDAEETIREVIDSCPVSAIRWEAK